MADTIITVNAEGGADYTSLVTAIENSARDIGDGNRLIFECTGNPQTIGNTLNLATLGYGETGILVIKGNTQNPLIPRTSEFVLYIQSSGIFNTQNSCRLDIENLTLDSNTYTSFVNLIRGVDSNQRFRGGEIRNSRIIKKGSNPLTLFRSTQTTSGEWVSNVKDSIVIGSCIGVIGSYANLNTTEILRTTFSDVLYLTHMTAVNTAPIVIDSAINLTGDNYVNGGVEPVFTNCATLDGVGTNPVPYSNWDSLFEDSVNGDYTLAGNSPLLDAGSTGNNISADQTTEATLPIIVTDSPVIVDGDTFNFSLSNLDGTISAASISGISILSLLNTNDAAQANSFTIDYWNHLSQSSNVKEKLPLIGTPSELSITTENGTATLDITFTPRADWDFVVVSDSNKENNSLASTLEEDLSLVVEDGDVFYYSTSNDTLVDNALNYSSNIELENEHTDFILQKRAASQSSYDSYAGEFFPYQGGEGQTNITPTANAGTNQTVTAGSLVQLDGSGSLDGDGTIASYVWTQTLGDMVTLTDANTPTPSFTAPTTNSSQTLTFQLVVTDNEGANSTPDTVDIQVAEDNVAPVITLVGNTSVTVPFGGTYTDEGATALDNLDGDITADIVTVNNVDTSVAGNYIVTYNVTDGAGNSASQVSRSVTVEEEIITPVQSTLTVTYTGMEDKVYTTVVVDVDNDLVIYNQNTAWVDGNHTFTFTGTPTGTNVKVMADDGTNGVLQNEVTQ